MNEKERLIKEILYELGLSRGYKGYDYLFYALMLLIEQCQLLTCLKKGLYSKIADYYHVNISSVERNLRTVVYVIWEKNRESSLFKKYTTSPSIGEFLDLVLYEIEKRLS